MISAIAFVVSISYAQPAPQVVDFDSVNVTAVLVKPNLLWISELSKNICKDDVLQAQGVECLTNPDYQKIITLCRKLKDSDNSYLREYMLAESSEEFHALKDEKWIGCVYNEKTGWEVFKTNLSFNDGELLMYDDPKPWRFCSDKESDCGADTVFDDRIKDDAVFGLEDSVSFHPSYILSVWKQGSVYLTAPSALQKIIEADWNPWYSFAEGDSGKRFDLPKILFVNGSVALFSGQFTSGIIFQSMSGHNYSELHK
jgi:hypothetical protein